ncbi:jg7083 [Pararge aegeria aegeria]|uniref:Jg7083 protein n=1 Tax=Pararge aegeria aegeria TaxID=348720 RepID=A0A8S4R0X1_9NEOP|nr:jg7083 [Pararge aegeria aegeria]
MRSHTLELAIRFDSVHFKVCGLIPVRIPLVTFFNLYRFQVEAWAYNASGSDESTYASYSSYSSSSSSSSEG